MAFVKTKKIDDLAPLQPTAMSIGDTEVLLVRDNDTVYAYEATCPHAGAPLAEGTVCEGKIICPWHKAVFALKTGALCEPPALSGLKKFPVKLKKGEIWVDPDEESSTDKSAVNPGDNNPHFAIIGSGAAGAAAIKTLVDEGFSGTLTVVETEPQAPYDRTSLSKFVPAGEMTTDDVSPLLPNDFMAHHSINRITGRVQEVDPTLNIIRMEDGASIGFDKLLIASGAKPVKPPIPGVELKGVYALRNIHQAHELIDQVETTQQLIVVGNSFIGMEIAAAFKQRSEAIHIRVVAPDALPFEKIFGERIGEHFKTLHQEHGVELIQGKVAKLLADEQGAVAAIELDSGEHLKTQAVLMATGVKPASDFAKKLTCSDDGGLVVNEFLEASPNIYAAGDIASFPYNHTQVRIEHWRLAQQQGRIAAQNMLGQKQPFNRTPYFWTQQFGYKYEYVGHADAWDKVEIIGSLEDGKFSALYENNGRVTAFLTTGDPELSAKLLLSLEESMNIEQAKSMLNNAA